MINWLCFTRNLIVTSFTWYFFSVYHKSRNNKRLTLPLIFYIDFSHSLTQINLNDFKWALNNQCLIIKQITERKRESKSNPIELFIWNWLLPFNCKQYSCITSYYLDIHITNLTFFRNNYNCLRFFNPNNGHHWVKI